MQLTRYQALLLCTALIPASTGPARGQDDRFGVQAVPPPSLQERERPQRAARPPVQKQKAAAPKARSLEGTRQKKAQPKTPAAAPPKPAVVQPPPKPAVVQPKPADTPSVPVPPPRPTVVTPPPAPPVAPAPVQPAQTPPPPPVQTPPIRQTIPAPPPPQPAPASPAAQAAVSDEKLAVCYACHGPAGRSETPEMPSLAGQPEAFIFAQLKMLRDGKRKIDAMQPIMSEFSEASIRVYAEKISKLPKPPAAPSAPTDMARYDRGQKLAAASRCANCHNNDFSGAGTNPSLARQRDDYLVKALRDYKSGARVDAGNLMVSSVKDLKDSDFIDLAYYLANLR